MKVINKKRKLQIDPIKTYFHVCYKCEKDFDVEQRMDSCPDCKKPFDKIYEHFVYPSKLSRIYNRICDDCKIIVDSDQEEQVCPRCKKLSKDFGFTIRDSMPTTFWQKFMRKIIKNIFP